MAFVIATIIATIETIIDIIIAVGVDGNKLMAHFLCDTDLILEARQRDGEQILSRPDAWFQSDYSGGLLHCE